MLRILARLAEGFDGVINRRVPRPALTIVISGGMDLPEVVEVVEEAKKKI